MQAPNAGAAGKVKQYCFDSIVLVMRKRNYTVPVLLTDLLEPLIP